MSERIKGGSIGLVLGLVVAFAQLGVALAEVEEARAAVRKAEAAARIAEAETLEAEMVAWIAEAEAERAMAEMREAEALHMAQQESQVALLAVIRDCCYSKKQTEEEIRHDWW